MRMGGENWCNCCADATAQLSHSWVRGEHRRKMQTHWHAPLSIRLQPQREPPWRPRPRRHLHHARRRLVWQRGRRMYHHRPRPSSSSSPSHSSPRKGWAQRWARHCARACSSDSCAVSALGGTVSRRVNHRWGSWCATVAFAVVHVPSLLCVVNNLIN
jgi:hypothetical protein